MVVAVVPRREPAIDERVHVAVQLVRDHVCEDRELVAPALHVLIARARFGELVDETHPRAACDGFEDDGHARPAGRHRCSGDEAVGEGNARGGIDFEYLADRLDPAGMAHVDAAAGTRVDGRSRAPPCSPAIVVREVAEHGGLRRLDHEGPVELWASTVMTTSCAGAASARGASVRVLRAVLSATARHPTSLPAPCR